MMLLENEVHLWCVFDEEITSSLLLSQYQSLLSREEQDKYRSFYFDRHRHQYLVTRALVRTVLSAYMPNIRPKEWRFNKNKYGKPNVMNAALKFPVEFNISHCDKLIVLVVTNGVAVGVDVECMLRDRKKLDIAYNYFSSEEIKALKSLKIDKQYGRFYDLWTLKEAYIKARGTGLSVLLDKFIFEFLDNKKVTIAFDGEAIDDEPNFWRFWQIRPNNTHKISIALRDDDVKKKYSLEMRTIIPLGQVDIVNYEVMLTG